MNGNFKIGTYLTTKYPNKEIYCVVELVEARIYMEPHFRLRDSKGLLWIATIDEMYSRFKILTDQKAAQILYGNTVGGIR